MNENSKIFVAGHRGMVGSAIVRRLELSGFKHLMLRTSKQLDLRNQQAVFDFFEKEKPEYVFLAAATVGGINANNIYRAEFIYNNLAIQNNIIHASYLHGVKKLLFLGSSCIYPKNASQPMTENQLLTGVLEPTNEPYAIAKIAGIKMCEAYRDQYGCNFISAMPTNLYGPNDNYDLANSHVLPALLRKFHEGKVNNSSSVTIWGTGKPQREFLHVDDLADALLFLMHQYNEKEFINVGYGKDLEIRQLAELIKGITGFQGSIEYDATKPDGTIKKLMSSEKLHSLGWKPKIPLDQGVKMVYEEFLQKANQA